MSSESGFSTQKKVKEAQYKTIHGLGSDRFGSSISLKHLANIGAVKPLTNSLLSDDRNYVTLEIAAHTARVHDIIRVVSGAQALVEYEVVEILDPNILIVINAGQLVIPQIGDNVQLARWVTSSSDVSGTPASSAPVGGSTEAKQDAEILTLKPSALSPRKIDDISVVTTGAYVNVGAVTIGNAHRVQIFMSSGEPLWLAFAGVDKIIIIPGGNGFIEMQVPAGTQLQVKAIYAQPDSGRLLINLFGA